MKYYYRFAILIIMGVLIILLPLVAKEQAACKWLEKPVDDQTFKTYLDFFTYDQRLPFKLQSIEVKEHEGIRKEHLSFQSTPEECVFANLYSVAGQSLKKGPALILLHGGSPQGKDSPYNDNTAELLARGGWIVLAIDLQYFGERSTNLLTKFTEKEKHERLYNKPSIYLTWMIQNVKDISRSFDFLVDHVGVAPKRIGLIGISRGAVVAPIAGGAEHRLAAIVLLYGGHFDALERDHLPAACPANYIGRISPRPLLMINGTRDADFIKETSVSPLYMLAKQPKKIIWVEGGHGSITEDARATMLLWLQENAK
jgi:dienelactone hydrolase